MSMHLCRHDPGTNDRGGHDAELDAIVADLVAAGLLTVGTDTDGHETWTLTPARAQATNQMAMSSEDGAGCSWAPW